MNINVIKFALIITLLSSQTVWAEPPRRNGPPPEAIEACEGKTEGDSITFETHRGDTLEGTCQTIQNQLVAVPNNHKRRE